MSFLKSSDLELLNIILVSSAKRLSLSEQGQGNVSDLPRSGRSSPAVGPLISRGRAAHQQLWHLQQCNELTLIFEMTGGSQPGNLPLFLVLVREAWTKSFTN
jgi:hypothetical protein